MPSSLGRAVRPFLVSYTTNAVTSPEPARTRGRRTRAAILEQAVALFARRGMDDVSLAEVAEAAGVFPSQITYYFASKPALFVHSAFALLLRDAERLERVGRRQRTPEAFRTALARAALALPSVPLVTQALAVAAHRPELQAAVQRDLTLLFRSAQRYLEQVLAERDWAIDRAPDVETRTFWSTVLGARLVSESGFGGRSADLDVAGVLTVRAR